MIYYLYDRWGTQKGTLTDISSATRHREINGEDSIDITTQTVADKGDRIVFCDDMGLWCEYEIKGGTSSHEDGLLAYTYHAENSICELNGQRISDKRPSGAATNALSVALADTRWSVGNIDVTGENTMSFYEQSVLSCIDEIVDAYSAEVTTTIEVSNGAISARKINLLQSCGQDNGKRFTYGKDLTDVKRTVSENDVFTAIYCYGKGEECYDEDGNATGGYGRRITISDVNNGVPYLEDLDALERWGIPDGKGGKTHFFGEFEASDCEDPAELLELGKAALPSYTTPSITYEAGVIPLKAAGLDMEGVSIGDSIAIIDTVYEPELRLSGRVLAIDEDLLAEENTTYTFGTLTPTILSTIESQSSSLSDLSTRSTSWDSAANANSNYLNAIIKRLNQEFDNGNSYKYESFEIGTIYSSVPLDENFHATSTPVSAIQLSQGGFRIANSLKSDGSFDWRTFGTGDGFTADLITVGRLVCGDNVIDLDHGTISLSQTVTSSIVSEADTNTDNKLANYATNESLDSVNTSLTDQIASANEATENLNSEVKMWLNMSAQGLTIGKSSSSTTVNIDNENVSFSDAGVVVANMSNQELVISNATVSKTLRFGGFAWYEREGTDYLGDGSHNVGLKWVE